MDEGGPYIQRPVSLKEMKRHRCPQREDRHGTTEIEIGAIQPSAEAWPDTWVAEFQPPELWKNNFLLF